MSEPFHINVPKELVDSLYEQLVDINRPERMHDLRLLRWAFSKIMEELSDQPELMYDDDFYETLVRSMAIKIALEERNCFYSC
jgi:hypothetical protein